MASFVYTPAKALILSGSLNFASGGDDLRVLLAMTNTTADTLQDAHNLDEVSLDEYDGSAYVRKTLASEAVNRDDANNRAEFDAADITWTALGAGTRQAQGMVLYQHVDGTAANDILVAWIDTGGFPFTGNGGDVSVTWNAEGILQAT